MHSATTTKTLDPMAAFLDAQVEAHHRGVCDDEVATLAEIGEDIARCAQAVAEKLSRLTDGRMFTTWTGRIETRRTAVVDVHDLLACMAEGGVGGLDAFPVIRTAAELYLSTPAPAAQQKAA